MIELKKKINEIFKKMNQDWVEALKNAGDDGIDISDMIAKSSEYSAEMDNAFMEYHAKVNKNNNKSFWGK